MTVPLCKKCRYAEWIDYWRCCHPRASEINPVDGEAECRDMRLGGPCKPSGLLFESKPDKRPSLMERLFG